MGEDVNESENFADIISGGSLSGRSWGPAADGWMHKNLFMALD